MAYQMPGLILSLLSSGGSTGDQYKGVVATSTASAGGYAVVATRGGKPTGVLLGNSTEAVVQEVQVSGVVLMQAGDSSGNATGVKEGIEVAVSSVGHAVFSTGGAQEYVIGSPLAPMATDSTGIIPVLLNIYRSSS